MLDFFQHPVYQKQLFLKVFNSKVFDIYIKKKTLNGTGNSA